MNTRLLTLLGSVSFLALAGCSSSHVAVAPCCASREAASCPECAGRPGVAEISGAAVTETLLATPLFPPEARPTLTLEHRVTTQDGTVTTLQRLLDRPAAISFAYSRCTNPNKCPRVISAMGALRGELERAGLLGRVRLLVISYDPEHDSPAELRTFAKLNGLRLDDQALFLQPECDPQHRLFRDLGVAASFNDNGVAIHGIQLLLLDKQGRLARGFHTLLWDEQQVLSDLKQLAAE
jgi:cytochrome oxidase Cu insertion factor (SCO1/SenC/PrrC family)